MKLSDVVAFVGHQVHVCRYREAGTLLGWMGSDLRGKKVLDVAGGDGYWAGQTRKRGAHAVSIDLARGKMEYGQTLAYPPALIECDALKLPFHDGSFDAILSVCAIEHFDDGGTSLDEMSRVLKPGGQIFMSADVLSRADSWPKLRDAHKAKYHVQHTYTHESLAKLMDARGLDLVRHSYQFRTAAAERLYLSLSAYGGKVGFNAAAPLAPLVAAADAKAPNERGSIVLVQARKRA
ncbi:class I SAM-dependent methyltransferase [Actinomadura rupiterrae]|uniref:class I SAM-dependent methyltransferase n=1 Tax=Actinomadura rupiterrae TaxID=559627 RepID=UPI0020A48FB0|nr:class I SAM-dependent methyltransferase [Actinomadura rupiterrae]MCP2335331.1 ubiquinone/menaquinone biosynthesis C-methylase UbiE [Actinomadura rupiterrae]